jgi:hypothetical protein
MATSLVLLSGALVDQQHGEITPFSDHEIREVGTHELVLGGAILHAYPVYFA